MCIRDSIIHSSIGQHIRTILASAYRALFNSGCFFVEGLASRLLNCFFFPTLPLISSSARSLASSTCRTSSNFLACERHSLLKCFSSSPRRSAYFVRFRRKHGKINGVHVRNRPFWLEAMETTPSSYSRRGSYSGVT